MSDHVKTLIEARASAWEQAKEILDRCAQDKRERSAEENEMFDRANADIDRLGREIDDYVRMAQAERENDTFRSAFEHVVNPDTDRRESARSASALESFLRTGDTSGFANARGGAIEIDMTPAYQMAELIRSGASAEELRAIYSDGGSSAGSLVVPNTFVRSLYQYIEASSAIRRLSYVFQTASGEAMTFPKVVTHGVGTQVIAQGTAIGGTDPVFGTIRLDAFNYGQLVRVGNNAAADVGFPLLDFVAQNIGRALGRISDTAYVTGSGSGAPNGIVTAAGTGVKTGGSLIPLTFENLIDLQHSVVDEYRNSPSAAFVMNDLTAGTLRKIRDGSGGTIGSFIWTPAMTTSGVAPLGLSGYLLGSPAYTDTNFATQGSASRSVAFGDWSRYWVRDSGTFRLERSDDRYFDTDEIAYRGVLRTDGELVDTGAIKTTAQLP